MNNQMEFQRAKEWAINYLSYRPRSSQEVRNYLLKKGFSPQVIEQAIADLIEFHYLDDALFALKWYKTRLIRGSYGPLLIERELMGKGIPKGMCETIRREVYPEEKERENALYLIRKQIQKGGKDKDRERTVKNYQLLLRRGFSLDIIKEVIRCNQDKMGPSPILGI